MFVFLFGILVGLAIGWSTTAPKWFIDLRVKTRNYLERL